jgi:hypothetical protein
MRITTASANGTAVGSTVEALMFRTMTRTLLFDHDLARAPR